MAKKAKKIEPLTEEVTFSGPGSRLRYARERKAMSLEDVAKHLRLSPRRLTEIENDNYLNLGAGTFARGYLRSYARLVNVSEQQILEEYETLNFDATIPSQKPNLLEDKRIVMRGYRSSNPSIYWLIFGLIILVLIIAGFLWRYNHINTLEKAFSAESAPTQAPLTPIAPAVSSDGQMQTLPLPVQTVPKHVRKSTKNS